MLVHIHGCTCCVPLCFYSPPSSVSPPPPPASYADFMVQAWWGRNIERHDWHFRRQPATQLIGHVLFMPSDKRVYKTVLKVHALGGDGSVLLPGAG